MDAWSCVDCGRQFPTQAFTCKWDGCDGWVVGYGDYCADHQKRMDRDAAQGG